MCTLQPMFCWRETPPYPGDDPTSPVNATARGNLWAKSYPSDRGTSSDFPHCLGFRAENRVVVPLRFSTKSLSRDSLNPSGPMRLTPGGVATRRKWEAERPRSTWYRKHRGHPLCLCVCDILYLFSNSPL